MKRTIAAVLGVALTGLFATSGWAQQGVPVRPIKQVQNTSREVRRVWNEIQGFNIVLLAGDLQGSSGPVDDLPAGARRALNDMKEFLPYKGYRVLDSQWTSCCGGSPIVSLQGRLQGISGAGESGAINRMYSFTLSVNPNADGSDIQVHFSLHEVNGTSDHGQALVAESRVQEAVERSQAARQHYEDTRKRVSAGVVPSKELQMAEARVREQERDAAALRALLADGRGRSGRTVISSSFTMDIGETVVVGTSRLGDDRALIALLTAARKSGGTGR